ncbi:DUF7674 family protein [Spirosoma foliorum]|uniref:DUF7674 domain-containing protein n=1 Tax=Spirosoma foliorum TaxID=2710596 RepID=A0A7G5GNA1_9BACT|nr:hypothetical protein [Spirosoma foliorum]QMW00343.1 hypothetical protein H3H32_20230 [Spirosoma foliorum]
MEDVIHKTELLSLLINRLPESREEFMGLPQETSIHVTLHLLSEVTVKLAHQHKHLALERCLLTAEEVLINGDKQVSDAFCTVYMYQLSMLMRHRDADSELIHRLLPYGLRTEYQRQLTAGLS